MNDYKLHYKYLNEAIKKIKRSVRYFINKGETDMWHSVKIDINNDPDTVLKFLYYDFHILLDQINEDDPYEIDVYSVFYNGINFLEVDTSELLYQYHIPFKPKIKSILENERNKKFLLEFKDIRRNQLIKINKEIEIYLSNVKNDQKIFDEFQFFKRKFDELIYLLGSD